MSRDNNNVSDEELEAFLTDAATPAVTTPRDTVTLPGEVTPTYIPTEAEYDAALSSMRKRDGRLKKINEHFASLTTDEEREAYSAKLTAEKARREERAKHKAALAAMTPTEKAQHRKELARQRALRWRAKHSTTTVPRPVRSPEERLEARRASERARQARYRAKLRGENTQ